MYLLKRQLIWQLHCGLLLSVSGSHSYNGQLGWKSSLILNIPILLVKLNYLSHTYVRLGLMVHPFYLFFFSLVYNFVCRMQNAYVFYLYFKNSSINKEYTKNKKIRRCTVKFKHTKYVHVELNQLVVQENFSLHALDIRAWHSSIPHSLALIAFCFSKIKYYILRRS